MNRPTSAYTFTVRPEAIVIGATAIGFVGLPIDVTVVQALADLPVHHRDPFDRLLIVQALAGSMHFYTADRSLTAYTDLVHLVR